MHKYCKTGLTPRAAPGGRGCPPTGAIGLISFGITIISAVAAWTSRETNRVRLDDLGQPDAAPVQREDYERIRAAA